MTKGKNEAHEAPDGIESNTMEENAIFRAALVDCRLLEAMDNPFHKRQMKGGLQ